MQQVPDMSELLKLARSPAGQELLALLQQSGGNTLQNAITKASSGDFSQAKEALSVLLDSPKARKLLQQLEDSK